MRIGIDVGGTHTDAVLMDGTTVVAATKQATTADVAAGITNALDALPLADARPLIDLVTIGTTQFTNAVVERRHLERVAAVRVVAPAGQGLEPRMGWPDDIAAATDGGGCIVAGGHLYDGRAIAPLDVAAVETAVKGFVAAGINNFAVAAAFSPVNPKIEDEVETIIRSLAPGARVTRSNALGGLGLVERENAAILNAALLPLADRVTAAFAAAIAERQLDCPVFVSQNDGTLMTLEEVRRFPALTFSSGPTNSIRGAWQLTGLDAAIVIDIGGTTSDLGVLQNGFPRQSNLVVEVGGVRTNFRMPDINAIGLGGGSVISDNGAQIGPRSVGHELSTRALAVGGDVLTTTDVAVAAGHLEFGDRARLGSLSQDFIAQVETRIRHTLGLAADSMKPGSETLPIILVGGGAVLLQGDTLAGGVIVRPEHSGVANAIGASIAQVSGEAERFLSVSGEAREAAIKALVEEAQSRAIAAGGDPDTLRTLELEEAAIPYMEEGNVRVRTKVVADLHLQSEKPA